MRPFALHAQQVGLGDFGRLFYPLFRDAQYEGLAVLDVWESTLPDTGHIALLDADIALLGGTEIGAHATDVVGTAIAQPGYRCGVGGWLQDGHLVVHAEEEISDWLDLASWLDQGMARRSSISHSMGGLESINVLNANHVEHPEHLLFLAPGNSSERWSQISNSQKNPLVVGSIASRGAWSSATSRGPSPDGRLKPDVVAPGSQRVLPSSPDEWHVVSGTSFSTPWAASAMVSFEASLGYSLPGDVLKAFAILGSIDLGAEGPDYRYGHGALDGVRLASLFSSLHQGCEHVGWLVDSLDVSDAPIELHLPPTAGPVHAVLVWFDPGSSESVEVDLDLRGEVNGEIFYPWRINPTPFLEDQYNLSLDTLQLAEQGDNTLDNVENLSINGLSMEDSVSLFVSRKPNLGVSQKQRFALAWSQLDYPMAMDVNWWPGDVPEVLWSVPFLPDSIGHSALGWSAWPHAVEEPSAWLFQQTNGYCTTFGSAEFLLPECTGDLNRDGRVSIADLMTLLSGMDSEVVVNCNEQDVNRFMALPHAYWDVDDLMMFLSAWGEVCW